MFPVNGKTIINANFVQFIGILWFNLNPNYTYKTFTPAIVLDPFFPSLLLDFFSFMIRENGI